MLRARASAADGRCARRTTEPRPCLRVVAQRHPPAIAPSGWRVPAPAPDPTRCRGAPSSSPQPLSSPVGTTPDRPAARHPPLPAARRATGTPGSGTGGPCHPSGDNLSGVADLTAHARTGTDQTGTKEARSSPDAGTPAPGTGQHKPLTCVNVIHSAHANGHDQGLAQAGQQVNGRVQSSDKPERASVSAGGETSRGTRESSRLCARCSCASLSPAPAQTHKEVSNTRCAQSLSRRPAVRS